MVRLKTCVTILYHPLSFRNIVESLQFWARLVVIGLVVDGVTRFKYEGLDIFAFRLCLGRVVEMTIVSIKEEYLIFDRGGAAYVGELGHSLKPLVSFHVARWCMMDCPFQWDVVMEILVVLLGLVKNDGRHKTLPIISGKDK